MRGPANACPQVSLTEDFQIIGAEPAQSDGNVNPSLIPSARACPVLTQTRGASPGTQR